MPLTRSDPVLSAAMRVALLANPAIGMIDGPALTAFCDAISQTVLAHVVANAVVVVAPGIVVAGTGGGPAPVVGATTSTGAGTVT